MITLIRHPSKFFHVLVSSSAMPTLKSDYLHLLCDYFFPDFLLEWTTGLRIPRKQIHPGELLIFFSISYSYFNMKSPNCLPPIFNMLCVFKSIRVRHYWNPRAALSISDLEIQLGIFYCCIDCKDKMLWETWKGERGSHLRR